MGRNLRFSKRNPTKEVKKINKDLTYTDEEGNKLHGFSVADMEAYNKRLDIQGRWLRYFVGVLIIWTIIAVWLINYIIQNNVINNIVARCI